MKKYNDCQAIDGILFDTVTERINHEAEIKRYSTVLKYVTLRTCNQEVINLLPSDITAIFVDDWYDYVENCDFAGYEMMTFSLSDVMYIEVKKCDNEDIFEMAKQLVDSIICHYREEKYCKRHGKGIFPNYTNEEYDNYDLILDNFTDNAIYYRKDKEGMHLWHKIKPIEF